MQMVDMFYDQLEDAKQRKVPFVIPIGTIEYLSLIHILRVGGVIQRQPGIQLHQFIIRIGGSDG